MLGTMARADVIPQETKKTQLFFVSLQSVKAEVPWLLIRQQRNVSRLRVGLLHGDLLLRHLARADRLSSSVAPSPSADLQKMCQTRGLRTMEEDQAIQKFQKGAVSVENIMRLQDMACDICFSGYCGARNRTRSRTFLDGLKPHLPEYQLQHGISSGASPAEDLETSPSHSSDTI